MNDRNGFLKISKSGDFGNFDQQPNTSEDRIFLGGFIFKFSLCYVFHSKYIEQPAPEVGKMLRRVRSDVIEETDEEQITRDSSSLVKTIKCADTELLHDFVG